MKYVAFLPPQGMSSVYAALGGYGTIEPVRDTKRLLSTISASHDDCLVIDPALITPQIAEAIAANVAEFPRALVAFSSVSTTALECAVILAQRTRARFVFRGTPNDRSALERALLLIPYSDLCTALLSRIESNIDRLPPAFRGRVLAMFANGDGPHSPDALSAASALTRRTLDRYLADAGFSSARRLVEAAHITTGYRAITATRIPLKTIASMLGYTVPRTMDAQFTLLLQTTTGQLRARPLPYIEVADRLAAGLTDREAAQDDATPDSKSMDGDTKPSLTLIDGRPRHRHVRLRASGDTGTKP